MKQICKYCRHWRSAGGFRDAKTGEIKEKTYCHASRNYADRGPEETCKRWHYNPALALE